MKGLFGDKWRYIDKRHFILDFGQLIYSVNYWNFIFINIEYCNVMELYLHLYTRSQTIEDPHFPTIAGNKIPTNSLKAYICKHVRTLERGFDLRHLFRLR